jgi:hypothetical protein
MVHIDGSTLDNTHSIALFALVVVTVASSQHLFAKVPAFTNPDHPTALMALLAGAIVSLLLYIPVKFLYGGSGNGITNNQVMSISVLVGLVSSYFMVFTIEPGLPSISSLALMVFMFYHHFDQQGM